MPHVNGLIFGVISIHSVVILVHAVLHRIPEKVQQHKKFCAWQQSDWAWTPPYKILLNNLFRTSLILYTGRKVKLSLSVPWGHIKESRGLPPFALTLSIRCRWVVNIRTWPIYPGTHWMQDWVRPRARLEDCGVEKISCFSHNLNPTVQPVARCYTDCTSKAPHIFRYIW
jgi:hypothetical protein